METVGPLPHSEQHATCPYPQPDLDHAHHSLVKDPFYYYPQSTPKVFEMISLAQISPPKPCMHLSCLPQVPFILRISFSLILSPE